MDATQALADAENALREFIVDILEKQFGSEWSSRCGVSTDRLHKWKERKIAETKTHRLSGTVDERLIFYADLYDLITILKAHWNGPFSEALGDQKTFLALLQTLEDLRNPDAHRRELLPHQKALAVGLSGEIRGRIVRYRSKRDAVEDAFPRIESARDSLGNVATGGSDWVHTKMTLRPGDQIDFVVTAIDPRGAPLEYGFGFGSSSDVLAIKHWQKMNTYSVRVEDKHVGKNFGVRAEIRGAGKYHAHKDHDDDVMFSYSVLPKRQ